MHVKLGDTHLGRKTITFDFRAAQQVDENETLTFPNTHSKDYIIVQGVASAVVPHAVSLLDRQQARDVTCA